MQWTIPTNIDHDFVQSHSRSETTMVIMATSAIKIWTMREQEEPTEISMPGSRAEGYPPSSGLSMKQMLTLLLFTTLLNFALTYSQALLNSWFWNKLATIWDMVYSLFQFFCLISRTYIYAFPLLNRSGPMSGPLGGPLPGPLVAHSLFLYEII